MEGDMPYYIELQCRTADQEQFTRLGLTPVSTAPKTLLLAGTLTEPQLIAKLISMQVPFHGFRGCGSENDPLTFASNGKLFTTMPTKTGDTRPYAVLDENGEVSAEDKIAAQRYYQIRKEADKLLHE
jgi:hypothetical protein